MTSERPLPVLASLVGMLTYRAMRADPVVFARAFGFEPWPYQADAMRALTERDSVTGKFTRPIGVVSWPRQQGKTRLVSTLGAWSLLVDDTNDGTIVALALDRAGAELLLGDARRLIQGSDILSACIDPAWGMTRNEIRTVDGRSMLVKAADAALSRGIRISRLLYDELGWTADQGALFDTASAAMGAAANPLTICASTVGPALDGRLWDLFQRAEQKDPNVRLIYSQENQSPKVTPEYLSRQEALLPPACYAREHLNSWQAGSDSYATMREWNAATNSPDPRRDSDAGPCYGFLDIGISHDESVFAVSKVEGDGHVAIIALETWRGTKDRPVVLAQVRARIEKLVVDLNVAHLTIESYQGLAMRQEINLPKTCTVDLLHATRLSNMERFGCLYRYLHDGRVRLPHDDTLRRELLGLTIVQTANGWHVQDSPSIHQDRVVACAGALYDATEGRPARWPHRQFMALVGDGLGVVSRDGQLVALVDDDTQAFRALSESRKTRVRQLLLSGTREETLRVQFSMSRGVLRMVLDEAGYQLPNPDSLAGQ